MRYFAFLVMFNLACTAYAIDSKQFATAGDSPWNQKKELNGVWVTDSEKIKAWASEFLKVNESERWKLKVFTESKEYFVFENGNVCTSIGEVKAGNINGEVVSFKVLASNIDGVILQNTNEIDLISMIVFETPHSMYIKHLNVMEFGITGARQYFKKIDNGIKIEWRGDKCILIQ